MLNLLAKYYKNEAQLQKKTEGWLCAKEEPESDRFTITPIVLTTELLPNCKYKMNCQEADLKIVKSFSHIDIDSVKWRSAYWQTMKDFAPPGYLYE